jgi:hypothetical protein
MEYAKRALVEGRNGYGKTHLNLKSLAEENAQRQALVEPEPEAVEKTPKRLPQMKGSSGLVQFKAACCPRSSASVGRAKK